MPRTTLTAVAAPGAYAAAGVALTMSAADVANKNAVVLTGGEILIAQNTDASPHTITVTSAPDEKGRLGNITAESIAAGAIRVYGPFQPSGWKQSDGKLYFEANDTTVKFCVLKP